MTIEEATQTAAEFENEVRVDEWPEGKQDGEGPAYRACRQVTEETDAKVARRFA